MFTTTFAAAALSVLLPIRVESPTPTWQVDYPTAAGIAGLFLSKDRKAFPVVVLDEDEIMPISLLRSLCRLYRVPVEDFGLSPEEDDD